MCRNFSSPEDTHQDFGSSSVSTLAGDDSSNMNPRDPEFCNVADAHSEQQQQTNHELQQAYNYLGRCIGYMNHEVDQSRLEVIFADTLSTLEKLTSGSQTSLHPQQMSTPTLLRKIGELVPKTCIDVKKIAAIKSGKGLAAARAAKLIALGDYIKTLRDQQQPLKGSDTVESSMEVAGNKQVDRFNSKQVSVERALELIENWCDAWIRGDLKGNDWQSFEDCLNGDIQ